MNDATSEDTASFSLWYIWWLALRPKTLPAAVSGVIVSASLAWYDGQFRCKPALAAIVMALLLQIGSNFANDVFDFERGLDTNERKGPMRVTQAGLLTPWQVKMGMAVVFAGAFLLWVYLAWVSSWWFLLLGVLAVIAAITYTGGPFPFGNYGLGDLMAFLFFGPVAVGGAYYVQARFVSPGAWAMSVAIGLLIAAILVVNNLRDIETDAIAGRRTLAVRWGKEGARREYLLCLLSAYLLVPISILFGWLPAASLLSWGSLAVAWPVWQLVNHQEGTILNKALAGTGMIVLTYSVLLSLGLALS